MANLLVVVIAARLEIDECLADLPEQHAGRWGQG